MITETKRTLTHKLVTLTSQRAGLQIRVGPATEDPAERGGGAADLGDSTKADPAGPTQEEARSGYAALGGGDGGGASGSVGRSPSNTAAAASTDLFVESFPSAPRVSAAELLARARAARDAQEQQLSEDEERRTGQDAGSISAGDLDWVSRRPEDEERRRGSESSAVDLDSGISIRRPSRGGPAPAPLRPPEPRVDPETMAQGSVSGAAGLVGARLDRDEFRAEEPSAGRSVAGPPEFDSWDPEVWDIAGGEDDR